MLLGISVRNLYDTVSKVPTPTYTSLGEKINASLTEGEWEMEVADGFTTLSRGKVNIDLQNGTGWMRVRVEHGSKFSPMVIDTLTKDDCERIRKTAVSVKNKLIGNVVEELVKRKER